MTADTAEIQTNHYLTRHPSASQVVLAYLDEQTATLKSLGSAVRREETEGVHRMRVTARRLRAALQSFTEILPAAATRRLRDDLKWLGGVLGEARDCEVLQEHLRTELAGTPGELVLGPAQARVQVHFASREAAARSAVLEALDSQRYYALLDELDRLLEDPPATATSATGDGGAGALAAAVARAYRRTRRRMRRARRTQAGPERDVALHEGRKAAKRARYAAEVTQPVFGKRARRFSRRMKAVQSVLGDHQDAVNAAAAAREIGVEAHLAGENAFSFGMLCERAHRDAVDYQDQARRVWKHAARGKSGGWPS
jgi:CHAD domain-containing protein